MTIEDVLDLYESEDGEVEELLAKVICLRQVKEHTGLKAAEAYLRFERAIALIREMEDELREARSGFREAGRRIRFFFKRRPPSLFGRRDQLWIACEEVRYSCETYRLYAERVLEAMRAALSIIFLR